MRSVPAVLVLALAALPAGPASGAGCAGGPANDCLEGAIEWFAEPRSFSNAGATMEAGEPSACDGATVHRSVWLRLDVLAPGAADPFMVELDAPFWATAGAYRETEDGTLAQVACAASWEDEGRHSPTLFLPCAAGATYWIQVGGQSPGDAGAFRLRESRYWKFDLTLSEVCPFKPSLPSEPRLTEPVAGNGKIGLWWVEPAWEGGRGVSVSHYNVYRADTCAGPFSLLASTAGRGYDDAGLPAGASFCYKVTAVNPVGEGPSEPGRGATTWDAPRPPRGLAVQPGGDGELLLSWLPSPDQAGSAPMLAHRVWRADAPDGPFEPVATLGPEARAYADAGLPRGATFRYRVSAVNEIGEGAPGDAAAGTTWRLPGAPRDVQVRQVLFQPAFHLSWQPPAEDAPFTHYRVYRAASADGPATFLGEVPRTTTSFTDGGRGLLVDVHYEVRASNPSGEGAPSARACAVYPLESPLARCG